MVIAASVIMLSHFPCACQTLLLTWGLVVIIWLASIDLALANMVGLADDAIFLHAFDDGCRSIVSDRQLPLYKTDRGFAFSQDDIDGFVVKVVAFAGA